MIVLDASAAVEWLLGRPAAHLITSRLADEETSIHAPSLLGVEVTQAMRRLTAAGHMSAERARLAITDLLATDIAMHDPTVLLERIWHWRDNLSAYDAAYVALAEALNATLLTADARIARAPGVTGSVEVVSVS